jgi:hypothetical protein
MNRPFPRLEVLGLTAALALVGACTPNNSVKPGAPVLIELSIVENGGAAITTVTPDTKLCPDTPVEGGACDPVMFAFCEAATNVCQCIPNPAPPPTDAGASDAATPDGAAAGSDAGKPDASTSDAGKSDAAPAMLTGSWSCTFAPTSTVLYVFDRVLDTEFLGDGGGAPGLASISSDPAAPTTVALNGDYASNGSFNIIFKKSLGDFRADGPSILFSAVPALPTSSTITVSLDKTKILAKDGRTPFTGTGLLKDGVISFVTQPFTASPIVPPAPPPAPADAGADAAAPNPLPDMTPATVTFTNIVDPTALAAHITVTAVPAAPILFDVASMDGLNVTITPKSGTHWPASSTITITIDAAATDAVGDPLAAPVDPISFSTSAM